MFFITMLKKINLDSESFKPLCILLTQMTSTYSNLTTETLENGVKYVQSLQQRHQNDE